MVHAYSPPRGALGYVKARGGGWGGNATRGMVGEVQFASSNRLPMGRGAGEQSEGRGGGGAE